MFKFFIIILFFFHFCVYSQEKSNLVKIGFGLTGNKTFIENLNTSDPGLKVFGIRQPMGFSLGVFRIKYNLNIKFTLVSSIDLYTLQGVRYYYYGSTYTSSSATPQINFGVKYKVFRSFFLEFGADATINVGGVFVSSENKNDYFPKNIVKRESFSGGFILPKIVIGIDKNTKNKNDIELFLSFTKGFKQMELFTLKRYQPYSVSTFTYKGSKVQFGINWYFNRKK